MLLAISLLFIGTYQTSNPIFCLPWHSLTIGQILQVLHHFSAALMDYLALNLNFQYSYRSATGEEN